MISLVVLLAIVGSILLLSTPDESVVLYQAF